MHLFSCALGSALIFAGCAAPYAEVSSKRPQLIGPPGTGPLALVEKTLTHAIGTERMHPLKSLGDCLDALQTASNELKRNPGDATAIRDYNFGVSRIFQIIHDGKLDPWTKPLSVPGPHGDFILTHRGDARPEWNPALYEFTPADEFDVGGKYVTIWQR